MRKPDTITHLHRGGKPFRRNGSWGVKKVAAGVFKDWPKRGAILGKS